MAKNKQVIYYKDLLNDDFAKNATKEYHIKDDYKYIKKNIFFRFFGFILYHVIAIPIFYLILKIKYHVKVYNKKAIKKVQGSGFFVYGNHTQNIIDALINQTLVLKNKGHIVAKNDVYSLKGLKTIVDMLGCLPTPNNMIQSKNFMEAVNYYIEQKHVIIILPEAHIWPYYNDIRPFTDSSFIFPSLLNKPVVASVVVYRRRKIFKNAKPYISLYLSQPFYPKPSFSTKENQRMLRDKVYNFMKETVKNNKSYEYIHYESKKAI